MANAYPSAHKFLTDLLPVLWFCTVLKKLIKGSLEVGRVLNTIETSWA